MNVGWLICSSVVMYGFIIERLWVMISPEWQIENSRAIQRGQAGQTDRTWQWVDNTEQIWHWHCVWEGQVVSKVGNNLTAAYKPNTSSVLYPCWLRSMPVLDPKPYYEQTNMFTPKVTWFRAWKVGSQPKPSNSRFLFFMLFSSVLWTSTDPGWGHYRLECLSCIMNWLNKSYVQYHRINKRLKL